MMVIIENLENMDEQTEQMQIPHNLITCKCSVFI